MWNLRLLEERVFCSDETLQEFCFGSRLIRLEMKCPLCLIVGEEEMLTPSNDGGFFGNFRCQKFRHRRHKPFKLSVAHGTWFENSHLPPKKILMITYCFAAEFTYDQTIREVYGSIENDEKKEVARTTISDWFNYCREVCMVYLDELYDYEGPIGGPGIVVEIDESKIGKRKYNKGRRVEGKWLFGLIERKVDKQKGRFRLAVLEDRTEETLLDLIQTHVIPGTAIHSDGWSSYQNLEEHGYPHATVIHDRNFVDPETGVHTQSIESAWRALKKRVCRGGCTRTVENLELHMCEFLFRHEMSRINVDIFEGLLEAISLVCRIREEERKN